MMSLEVTMETPDEIEVPTPAAEPITPTDATPAPEGNIEPVEPLSPVVDAPPAFAPNFKYSVKGQEKEIDEMFRSLIKDAESEKKIKELFEKADGIDHVKGDRDSIKKEYSGFKEQVIPHLETLHKFTAMRDQGNLGAAFKVAGITDEQVYEYALQKLELSQNPQQAQLFNNHTEASLKQIEMESQLQHYKQLEQQMQQQRFESDLDFAVNGQKDLASQVDQRLGKNGAFKEEVIALGVYEFNRGNHLSVSDAVTAVANKYKPFITPAPASITPNQQPSHVAPATIPTVGSSNVSVISQRPKNVDDLRKIEKAL